MLQAAFGRLVSYVIEEGTRAIVQVYSECGVQKKIVVKEEASSTRGHTRLSSGWVLGWRNYVIEIFNRTIVG